MIGVRVTLGVRCATRSFALRCGVPLGLLHGSTNRLSSQDLVTRIIAKGLLDAAILEGMETEDRQPAQGLETIGKSAEWQSPGISTPRSRRSATPGMSGWPDRSGEGRGLSAPSSALRKRVPQPS